MGPPDERQRKAPLPATILADETERGGDHPNNLGKRLGRYAVAHERALAMRDYIAHLRPQTWRHTRAAQELHHCGSYLVFRHYIRAQKIRLHGMRSCRQHTICPLCAIRRGGKMLARYLERFNLVRQENPELVAHMVTLTVKNGPDLLERFHRLHSSLKAFNKRRTLRDDYLTSESKKIKGAVWSYEFKRGENSGQWHPHVHAVWLCERDNPPSTASLSREWLEITGDSHIVETHPLYGEPVDAFAEVFKYAVKFSDLPLSDNLHAFDTLAGRRMIASSGLLFGVKIPDELTDEPIEGEAEWIDLFFRFVRGVGYRQVQTVDHMLAVHPSSHLATGHAGAGPNSLQRSGTSSPATPSTRP